jgi:hypothetical protein
MLLAIRIHYNRGGSLPSHLFPIVKYEIKIADVNAFIEYKLIWIHGKIAVATWGIRCEQTA